MKVSEFDRQLSVSPARQIWTSQRVFVRMVEMFDVLRRTPMRIGPKAYGSIWPTMADVLEVERDLIERAHVDYQAARILQARRRELEGIAEARLKQQREQADRLANRPVPAARETSMAEEAMWWPVRYLADRPLLADALNLWAFCSAYDFSMAGALRDRIETAQTLIRLQDSYDAEGRRDEQRREDRQDETIAAALRTRVVAVTPIVERRQSDEAYAKAALRAEIVAKAIAWANERLGTARDVSHAEAIKANAKIKVQREVKAAAAAARVRPEDVLPGRVFTRRCLDVSRKEAAAAIAAALSRDNVEVR